MEADCIIGIWGNKTNGQLFTNDHCIAIVLDVKIWEELVTRYEYSGYLRNVLCFEIQVISSLITFF